MIDLNEEEAEDNEAAQESRACQQEAVKQGPHLAPASRGVLNTGRWRGLTAVSPDMLASGPSPDRLGLYGRVTARTDLCTQSSAGRGRLGTLEDRRGELAARRDRQSCWEQRKRAFHDYNDIMCFSSLIKVITVA